MVTLKDLAQEAGVSIRTVARVLSGQGLVAEPTKARIQKAVVDLGYRPNLSARSVRSQRNGTVAMLLSADSSRSSMSRALLEGAEAGLNGSHYRFCLRFVSDADLTEPRRLQSLVGELGADGVMIHYPHALPPEAEDVLSRLQLPAVWTNRKLPHNAVYPDEYAAAYAATKLLTELGGHRMVYVHFLDEDRLPHVHFSAFERWKGYCDARAAAGRPPEVLRLPQGPDPEWSKPIHEMRARFGTEGPPDAVLAYSEGEAVALRSALQELGLKLGAFGPVLAFAAEDSAWALAHLGRLVIPERDMGFEAARMLLRKIDRGEALVPSVKVAYGEARL